MGNILNLSCGDCNYERQVRIGGGLMSINAKAVENVLSQEKFEEDLKQWKNLREGNKIKRFIWEYRLAYCEDCKDLKEVFDVEIETKDGNVLNLGCRCKDCKKKLKLMEKGTDIKCPHCKNALLKSNFIGNWD